MDKVKEIYLEKLTLEGIEGHLPEGYQQQLLDNACQGHQLPSTFILGRVNELSDKVMLKGYVKKLMVLKEVIADDSEGKLIRVTLYKDYAEAIDCIMKKWGSSKKLWIALSDAEIGKYMGLGAIEKWCPLCIHAGYAGFRPQIWLFRECTGSVAEQLYPPQTNGALRMANATSEKTFTPLKQCVIGSKYNVMAVVSEVVKYPSITRIGKLHMMFGIADQSCPVVDGCIKDILLQVFTTNTPEVRNILDQINTGDIVRLRGLMMENYKDAIRAKIFNENQLIVFSGDPENDIVPYTVHCSYFLTEREENKIRLLKEWGSENIGALSVPKVQPSPNKQQAGPLDTIPGNAAMPERMVDPIFLYLRISEVTGDRLFHLSCKVNVKQYLERDFNRIAVLRVCDGTRTLKNFRKWDLEETSEEYEDEVFAPPNSEEVDIIVMTNVNRLESVNVGDFILLKNITCTPLEAILNDEVIVFYELSMKNEDSIIRRLQKHDQAVKDIKRALEKKTDEREVNSSEDSLLNMFQKAYEKSAIHSKVSSAVKKSPNRIHCQPLSPQRSRRKSTPGSPRITPNSPRTLQREEKSPESLREITGFSSPKLPSATDSMDNAMRNINCIFDGEKSGLSPPHAEAMPVTSTLVSSPAREHLNSPRANFTVKPNLKDDISPILAPASGSNVLVQPEDDINPQPGCSKWFSGNGDGTKENLHLNGASKESLSLHIQKPKDFVAATRNSSFESLLPLSPIQESSSEECGVDLPLDLPSPSAHQSPCGIKTVAGRAKRKLMLSDEDESTEGSSKKKHPRLISDSAIQEPSKSKSEKDTDGEELPKLKELRAGTREELFEAETSTPEPKNTEKIGEIGTYRLKGTPTRQDFKGANSVKLGKKTTWKEPCVAITSQSGRETNREKFLEPNAVQVMRQMEEELTRQDSNKSKSKMTRCNGKELKEYHPVKKIPRLTTDFSQKAFYSTICDVKDSSEGVMYRVPGLVMQIGISSNQPCTAEECLQGICFHDWIWGVCTACGTQFESWELRENYSVEDFKSKFLPCIICSKDKPSTSCQTPRKGSKTRYSSPIRKSPRTKTGPLNQEKGLVRASHKSRDDEKSIGSASESCSIVPYICSWLILEDPEDDSNILVHVAGEDAKIFYGAEPTFEWLTGTPDNHIRRLVSVLLKQRAPLWYGVQKYTSENSGHYFLIRHTQIISGKYKDSV